MLVWGLLPISFCPTEGELAVDMEKTFIVNIINSIVVKVIKGQCWHIYNKVWIEGSGLI